jgi:acetoin utilization deacetylase AcuC-like enzyme
VKAVYSPATRLHDPGAEIWVGISIEGTEVAGRVDAIRAALLAEGHELVSPRRLHPGELERVHSPELIDYLREAWGRWARSSYPTEPGQNRVVPYFFPRPDLTSGRPLRLPNSVAALAGLYALDTMTLIGPGSWESIEAAAAAAITAAELVAGGDSPVYALCRPPGHHAGAGFYGGSCYLNNAALAAHRLLDLIGAPIAVIDLDAHHGNGTQEIFYRRAEVLYGSVHIDPGAGYFPHFLGFADEVGEAEGEGFNLNLPLPPGAGDREWLQRVERLVEYAGDARGLVISLGVDAWRDDPESPLQVGAGAFDLAGRLLGSIDRPTVVVQEGGYDLKALGRLVAGFLSGLVGPSLGSSQTSVNG